MLRCARVLAALAPTPVLATLVLATLAGGCTAILGIDESFTQEGAGDGGGPDGGTKPGADSGASGDGGPGADATTGGGDGGAGGEGGPGSEAGAASPWVLDPTFAGGGQAALTDSGVSAAPVSLVFDTSGRILVIGTATKNPEGTAYWVVNAASAEQAPPANTYVGHPTDAVLGDDGQVYVATTTSYEDTQSTSTITITGLLAEFGASNPNFAGNCYVERLLSVTGSPPIAHFYLTQHHDKAEDTSLDLDSGQPTADSVLANAADIFGAAPSATGDVVVGTSPGSGDEDGLFGFVNAAGTKLTAGTDASASNPQYTDVLPGATSSGYVALGVGGTSAGASAVFHVTWLSLSSGGSPTLSVVMDHLYPAASAAPAEPLLTEPASHTRLVADGDSFIAAGVFGGAGSPTLVRFGVDGGEDDAFGLISPPPVVTGGVAALGGLAVHGGYLYVAYSVTPPGAAPNGVWVVARYRRAGT